MSRTILKFLLGWYTNSDIATYREKPLTKSIRTPKSYNAILIVSVESNHISSPIREVSFQLD
jgi:hypothetical protein